MTAKPTNEDEEDVAQWLIQAGQRSRVLARKEEQSDAPKVEHTPQVKARSKRLVGAGFVKRTSLQAILALSFLQYYYIEVMIKINSLPTIIVFVPTQRHAADLTPPLSLVQPTRLRDQIGAARGKPHRYSLAPN
jgi:hypothetical protein